MRGGCHKMSDSKNDQFKNNENEEMDKETDSQPEDVIESEGNNTVDEENSDADIGENDLDEGLEVDPDGEPEAKVEADLVEEPGPEENLEDEDDSDSEIESSENIEDEAEITSIEESPSIEEEATDQSEHTSTDRMKRSKPKAEISGYEKFKLSRKKNFIERTRDASIVRKIVFVLIIIITALMIYGGKSAYEYVNNGLTPVDPDSEEIVEIDIPLGSSATAIAGILEDAGVISDELMYRLFIKVNNYAGFQAGEYKLSPSMSLAEISETLQTGNIIRNPLFTVTIPEGRTIEEIAVLFENSLGTEAEDFIELMKDEEYINQLIDLYPTVLSDEILQDDIRYPLEGYLFAATYPIYDENPEIDEVIRAMLNRTRDVIASYSDQIRELENFSIHDIMTFSSLVEREARDEEERRLISGVFYNRLAEGMRLETDPTVLYAHGKHKDRVLFKDLEIESPYNTYYVYGLPIGPISNFGTSSLQAVLEPAETSYLFFVAAPDGEIHFTETFEEHRELSNKLLDRDV